jgi:hypothetical protein
MSTLTRAELLGYPGDTWTDKALAHSSEHAEPSSVVAAPKPPAPALAARALSRRIDIRRYPGRDRAERVMSYVRAQFPRAEHWSEESVRQIANGLLCGSEIVE